MYFIKDKPEGYWDAKLPWFEVGNRVEGYSERNLLWHLRPFSRESSWHDEYMSGYGDERFVYNPTAELTYQNNFTTKATQYRYGSTNKIFPGYLIAPKYFGSGYGSGHTQATYKLAGPLASFCSIPEPQSGSGLWAVHIDKTSLSGYEDVIRIKYYEGQPGFTSDDTKTGLREDWYYAKGVGLVRIDTKNFGPYFDGPSNDRKPCSQDNDCVYNEYISDPHVTLSRITAEPTSTQPVLKLGR